MPMFFIQAPYQEVDCQAPPSPAAILHLFPQLHQEHYLSPLSPCPVYLSVTSLTGSSVYVDLLNSGYPLCLPEHPRLLQDGFFLYRLTEACQDDEVLLSVHHQSSYQFLLAPKPESGQIGTSSSFASPWPPCTPAAPLQRRGKTLKDWSMKLTSPVHLPLV